MLFFMNNLFLRLLIVLSLAVLVIDSCEKESPELDKIVEHEVLGKRLRNPYSISSMREACTNIYPSTKGNTEVIDSLVPINYAYVRFLPEDSLDVYALFDSELELYNYPLDYEIIGDVSDYHDPSIPSSRITWQYTVLPCGVDSTVVWPDSLERIGEVLDYCHIPDSSSGVPGIEEEAYNITGNGDLYIPSSTGSITINHDNLTTSGVKGTKVRARTFLKIRTGYPDENGNYTIQGFNDFKYAPRFELRFENIKGFKIGHGFALVTPTSIDMGKSQNMTIDRQLRTYWEMGIVNNAAYDWYEKCIDENICTPPDNLKIWVFSSKSTMGATMMLHHGVLSFTNVGHLASFLCIVHSLEAAIVSSAIQLLITWLGPDITISAGRNVTEPQLYGTVCHELSHASHYMKNGTNNIDRAAWWADVFNYELGRTLSSFSTEPYGEDGIGADAEKAGLTEAWAYAIEGITRKNAAALYGDPLDTLNFSPTWFNPHALYDLMARSGFSLQMIFNHLGPYTTTPGQLRQRLISAYPDLEDTINNCYDNPNPNFD